MSGQGKLDFSYKPNEEKYVQKAIDVAGRRVTDRLDGILSILESPLERRLFAAMIEEGFLPAEEPFRGKHWRELDQLGRLEEVDTTPGYSVELPCETMTLRADYVWAAIQPSFRIAKRVQRFDFAFFYNFERIVVELDGFAYHDATKELATKDKKRDRRSSISGWTILRFSGSEVVKDTKKVLTEILDDLETLSNIRTAAANKKPDRVRTYFTTEPVLHLVTGDE